jgi:hypothetical protein
VNAAEANITPPPGPPPRPKFLARAACIMSHVDGDIGSISAASAYETAFIIIQYFELICLPGNFKVNVTFDKHYAYYTTVL